MKFGDRVEITAGQREVWEFLLDPKRVANCGPGVESVAIINEGKFQAIVRVGIAKFEARFTVDFELTDISPPSDATIRARGSGPGTAVDAAARMRLTAARPEQEWTRKWT